MSPDAAARALNVEQVDYVYRLLRTGALKGRKSGGRWIVDDTSVQERAQRVALKRSSKLNAEAEKALRRAEIAKRFA